MAHDYWADYERHFEAFRRDCETVDRDYANLGAFKEAFDRGIHSADLMEKTRAKNDFMRYLDTMRQAIDIAQRQGHNALAKLQAVLQNRGPFADSGQHARNIQNAQAGLRAKDDVLVRERNAAFQRF